MISQPMSPSVDVACKSLAIFAGDAIFYGCRKPAEPDMNGVYNV
jgi:hypothetical protein